MYPRRKKYRRWLVFSWILLAQVVAEPLLRSKLPPAERAGYTIRLKKTKHASPASKVLTPDLKASQGADGVELQWSVPDSTTAVEIYRFRHQEMPAVISTRNPGDPPEFVDVEVSEGEMYTYYIKAVTIPHGSMWSRAVKIRVEAPLVELVQFEEIRSDTATGRIYFRWNQVRKPARFYQIFITRSGSTSLLGSVDGQATETVIRYTGKLRGAFFSIRPL